MFLTFHGLKVLLLVHLVRLRDIQSFSTNLAALQRPLKDLYFKWRALRNLGHSNLPGTLEINDNGLTVQYIRELHKGVQVRMGLFTD